MTQGTTIRCNGRPLRDVLEDLREPFRFSELEFRQQGKPSARGSVRVLTYVTRTAIIERLDSVLGAIHWQNEYRRLGEGSTICRLGIRCYWDAGNGKSEERWTWKEDGADETDIESAKGGISNSLKRAASAWGIGLYLYRMPMFWAKADGKYLARGWEDEVRQQYFTKVPPHMMHPDDRSSASGRPVKSPPSEASPAPSTPKMVRRHEPPPWIDDLIDGQKEGFKDKPWSWLLEESKTGGRVEYLRFHLEKEGHDKWKERCAVIWMKRCTGQWYEQHMNNGQPIESLDLITLTESKGLNP